MSGYNNLQICKSVFNQTFVCTVNFTLSFSLRASDISTSSELSVVRSTVVDLSCFKTMKSYNKKLHGICLTVTEEKFYPKIKHFEIRK